jgi:hypothetical protein
MSTEHQQYSTANQKASIAAYAAVRDIAIVATYEDSGRSGLTLAGRPALRQLIADVIGGKIASRWSFYDVSRWGAFRTQMRARTSNTSVDLLACVRIEYCGGPFSNDGTPFASICKVVKRALAAEYSRELSEKGGNADWSNWASGCEAPPASAFGGAWSTTAASVRGWFMRSISIRSRHSSGGNAPRLER